MDVAKYFLFLAFATTTALVRGIAVKIGCSTVICPINLCEAGERVRVPEGQCCPVCDPGVHCSLVFCIRFKCKIAEKLEVPEGQCCPVCVPDPDLPWYCRPPWFQPFPLCCRTVRCHIPRCKPGEGLQVPERWCCPVCVDCSLVSCVRPVCRLFEKLVVPEGECCPACVDCSLVSCVRPVCRLFEKLEVPEGECCPVCVHDPTPCAGVKCIPPVCRQLAIPQEGCCPVCASSDPFDFFSRKKRLARKIPDKCAGVSCIPPVCEEGEQLETPEGECCPVCSDPCSICTKGQTCKREVAPCLNPPCPVFIRCVDTCTLPPETGPCEALFPRFFHNATSMKCERFIYGGCSGNSNNFLTLENCEEECGVPSVSPCATVLCPNGFRCEVSNGGFCKPDCSIKNGGCLPNQTCRLEDVVCVRAPCPPARICEDRNPCATVQCTNGFRCKVSNGVAFCDPDCSLNNGGCARDQVCHLENVTCVTSPCPPTRICESPSPTSSPCPPTCSKRFCRKNQKALCSNPGPQEIPGCTGMCQLTYCRACYFSPMPLPIVWECESCSQTDYQSDTQCFSDWSKCTRRAHQREHGKLENRDPSNFRCHSPSCSLRG